MALGNAEYEMLTHPSGDVNGYVGVEPEGEFWPGNRKLGVVNKCIDGMRLSKQTVFANSWRH